MHGTTVLGGNASVMERVSGRRVLFPEVTGAQLGHCYRGPFGKRIMCDKFDA